MCADIPALFENTVPPLHKKWPNSRNIRDLRRNYSPPFLLGRAVLARKGRANRARNYSALSASTGSTLIALRAGMMLAPIVVTVSKRVTTTIVAGSVLGI